MDFLTKAKLEFVETKRTVKLLFGAPVETEDLGFSAQSSKRTVYFKPGSQFALELWAANDYGTAFWMVYVLRAVWPGEPAHRVPQVEPGAEILLSARGKSRVKKVIAWLDRLHQELVDPCELNPEYFQAAHYSLKNGLEPRAPYEPHGPVHVYLRNKAP
ncbi:MAG: DUF2840 domain-containing protein [Desulfobulbus sp.]|nr:DUF2840 domain-containing protein [Desulfobulbus sp.]